MSISKQRCCFKQSTSCTRGREVLIAEQRSSYRGFSAQYFRNINLPPSPVTNHFLHLLTGWNLTLKESIAGSWLAIICQASLLGDRASSHQQMKPFQCFHWCWLLFFHQHFQLTIAACVSVGGGSGGGKQWKYFHSIPAFELRKGNMLGFSWPITAQIYFRKPLIEYLLCCILGAVDKIINKRNKMFPLMEFMFQKRKK